MRLVRFYPSRGLKLVKGSMQYVWDDKGNRYLDANTGHGAAFLGHANPDIVEAVQRQVAEISVAGSSFDTPAMEEAVEWFSKLAPGWAGGLVFLNTGTEAVEAAIKMAWQSTGRRKLVALQGSFHGRTMASLSVTWNPRYRRGLPLYGDVEFIDPRRGAEAVEKVVDDETAAVIVEIVQGEGGVNPLTPELVKTVRDTTLKTGALMIVDEIQTGYGRTGRIWAHEHYNVEPDIITAGKAIAGGLPASAVIARESVVEKLKPGWHGSTHAGNPLAMAAVAAAARHFLENRVWEKAATAGYILMSMLARELDGLRAVRSIRGKGLMIGVDLRFDPGRVLRCLQEEKRILALKAGATVVRFLPPYMITGEDAGVITSGLRDCICRVYGC